MIIVYERKQRKYTTYLLKIKWKTIFYFYIVFCKWYEIQPYEQFFIKSGAESIPKCSLHFYHNLHNQKKIIILYTVREIIDTVWFLKWLEQVSKLENLDPWCLEHFDSTSRWQPKMCLMMVGCLLNHTKHSHLIHLSVYRIRYWVTSLFMTGLFRHTNSLTHRHFLCLYLFFSFNIPVCFRALCHYYY